VSVPRAGTGRRASARARDALVAPHGGRLVDLRVAPARAAELKAASRDWPSWDLGPSGLADLECLLTGAFSPLRGFMGRADHQSVCERLRLADGTLWPSPITLEVSEGLATRLAPGARLALRDGEGTMLAALTVEDVWRADPDLEAAAVGGPGGPDPARAAWRVGGPLEGLELPAHQDYRWLRLTPAEVRRALDAAGWRRVAALWTTAVLHRAEVERTRRLVRDSGAGLLIHGAVGPGIPGEAEHFTRVRCYEAVLRRYPRDAVRLVLCPVAPRRPRDRDALRLAIVARNFGCSHVITGVEPEGDGAGRSEEAAAALAAHARELGVAVLAAAAAHPGRAPAARRPSSAPPRPLDGGRPRPARSTYPEVARILRAARPGPARRGFTVFFTGLPSAGKSTIASILRARLLERGGRGVTLLDGDVVRRHLSSELGFSREHRDLNIRRIAFVAAEVTRHGGIAICAPIAPYDRTRKEARAMVELHGGFVLVLVSAPLEVCERRDRKGLYAKARAGLIKDFTGVSDPYEPPEDADLVLDTSRESPEQAARRVLEHLERRGYVPAPPARSRAGRSARAPGPWTSGV